MIKEFAVEPLCFSSWDRARYLIEKFGYPQGRLIARFPENWTRVVKDSCGSPERPRERKKIINFIHMHRKKIMYGSGRAYEDAESWMENACREDQIQPFHAVITASESECTERILNIDDLTESNELFAVEHDISVERSIPGFISGLELFLKDAVELVFIDPYFNRLNNRHTRVLLELVRVAQSRQGGVPLARVAYHFNNAIPQEHFIQNLKQDRNIMRLNNIRLDFYMWPEEKLHNRYLLSNRGGIQFGTGLDINEGTSTSEDRLNLLSATSHESLLNQFNRSVEPFFTLTL